MSPAADSDHHHSQAAEPATGKSQAGESQAGESQAGESQAGESRKEDDRKEDSTKRAAQAGASPIRESSPIRDALVAEAVGTCLLTFFGLGAIHTATLSGQPTGGLAVAVVWGGALALAVYYALPRSGAHLNPAITLAMVVWRGFETRRVLPYVGAQLVGALMAAALLFLLFSPKLVAIENLHGIVRGEPGSELTAACYAGFYPNPTMLVAASTASPSETSLGNFTREQYVARKQAMPHGLAFIVEALGTAVLTILVFALHDSSIMDEASDRHERRRGNTALSVRSIFHVGLGMSLLYVVLSPLTQACLNPARDFAPRVFAAVAGWGTTVIPLGGDWSWLTVYLVGPLLGAFIGGGLYSHFTARAE